MGISLNRCKIKEEWQDENPDIDPLKQGFKTTAAVGYCASMAASVFYGNAIPDNVLLESSNSNSGLIYVTIDENNPLPFNPNSGDIIIACYWGTDSIANKREGIMSIVFADIDIISSLFNFYGIHTVPISQDIETGKIKTLFAEQDIVFGDENDSLLNLSFSDLTLTSELLRLDQNLPTDPLVAVSQNAWFISINPHNIIDLYDDSVVINGGGQIAEVDGVSGGFKYHAMIETEYTYNQCSKNPMRGDAFIQKLKADNVPANGLGSIYLSFHNNCDGKAYVDLASGEYLRFIGRDVNLHFN